MDDDERLKRAVEGDEDAFATLLTPHRRAIAAHCYRMLGSVADADDAVQETSLRAWKALASFEGRAKLSTWLHAIATRVCLDQLAARRARTLPHDHGAPRAMRGPEDLPTLMSVPPDPEVPWLEPATPELALTQKESVRLAFIAALQHLPAPQRAVLLLRDVLGWSASDTADVLETSVPAVNSALQRAREHVRRKPLLARPAPPEPVVKALLERYIAAWESGAPGALVGVLRDDVLLTMPPLPLWLKGLESVTALVGALRVHLGPLRFSVVEAGGGPAVLALGQDTAGAWGPVALHVCEVKDDEIAEIHAFVGPEVLARFASLDDA